MSDGFNLEEALDQDSVSGAVRTFLGIQYETKVCPDCGVECTETTVYDVHTAAFEGGETPAFKCPECSRAWYREDRQELHATDLYDR
jgi:transposase-like protein